MLVVLRPLSFFAEFLLVVGLTRAWIADLTDGNEVQGTVKLAVASPGEPVAPVFAAGGLNGRDAAVAREVMASREATNIAGVTEDLCGQYRTDPVHLGQARAAVSNGAAARCCG